MSSASCCPPAKKEVCWKEKEGIWLNVVVKEENEEEDVTVNEEVEGEAVTQKEEEENDYTFFGVNEGEITVILKEEEREEEEETEDLRTPERDQTLLLTAGRVLQGNQTPRRPNQQDDITVPSVERVLLS
ncbi:uncharacterized protein LOC116370431 isoform X3 [Oncorhynchus kisutch]|uniref:uncharacterized protein LOC116370431 isoform X3 n=1 Tax=Oncorhynchus kisutch TaxID=8019 RepID=UPI0012DD5131|nr:uncharacterized protein LOC116370431 isoform X3 [Oncorhynchus kisutch]